MPLLSYMERLSFFEFWVKKYISINPDCTTYDIINKTKISERHLRRVINSLRNKQLIIINKKSFRHTFKVS